MTTEQQRIELAKLDGREPYWNCEEHGEVSADRVVEHNNAKRCPWCSAPLDYVDGFPIDDLNAVHELEKKFSPLEAALYVQKLEEICTWRMYGVVFATAPDRREAILKVKGLWR